MRHDTIDLVAAKDAYELRLENQYGPKPLNVFTRLRLSCDFSHAELARQMYTSKQSLIRLEQGCYDRPLPVAVDYWVNKANVPGLSELQLEDAYEDFQAQVRLRNTGYFGDDLVLRFFERPLVQTDLHPLVVLRRANHVRDFDVSVTEVAKALCVSQATLQHWETKWRLQKSVPKTFQAALLQIGYSRTAVNKFCDYYFDWRQVKLGRA